MANELIPFPSRNKTGSNSIFTRERLIAKVANLRYEIEIISIATVLWQYKVCSAVSFRRIL